jgi:hypothetical protein
LLVYFLEHALPSNPGSDGPTRRRRSASSIGKK